MPPPLPELMEELVEEILVRFPADDPASLVRAALVCKPWCRLVSGTAFRRRFREFHLHHRGGAPLLGVLYTTVAGAGAGAGADCCCHKHKQQQVIRDDDDDDERWIFLREPSTACFVPTAASFRPGPAITRRQQGRWRAIDARHGRVLLRRSDDPCLTYGRGLCVWDPVTDEHRDLPEPSFNKVMLGCHWTAAVACAAAGGNCDHLDCHRGPFLVLVMDVQDHVIYHSVYSSQSGAWTHLDVLERPQRVVSEGVFRQTSGVLVGSALYFLIHSRNEVVEYDLATQEVSTIDVPPQFCGLLEKRGVVLITDDDGGLGFVAVAVANTEHQHQHQLELWSMLDGGEGGFVQTRVIHLHKLLPAAAASSGVGGGAGAALTKHNSLRVNGFGFTDGVTASRFLFLRTSDGLYSLEINSSHVSKVANDCGDDEQDSVLVPYISFCTPTSAHSISIPGRVLHN